MRRQVERMLTIRRAPRSRKTSSASGSVCGSSTSPAPDMQLYPEFDEFLQWSMLRQTHLFFEEVLRNDLSVLNFIDSDFTMLNNRLAAHYGIEGVSGREVSQGQPQA
ncbi:MAG: DUF1592 domain-containing protein [Verrucomicrobiota bacterium]|nr:DUF1592 domain-containing protein [Verrucomicrobiota bacterium]